MKKYAVYFIEIRGIKRYIGITNNLERRQLEHNAGCFQNKSKKLLYKKIREIKDGPKLIKLKILKTFDTEIDARRYECLIILKDYFKDRQLWQRVPRISDI